MRQFKFSFLILALLLFHSCTDIVGDETIGLVEDSMTGHVVTTDAVTSDDIYRIASNFNKTRSSSCEYTLSSINDDNGDAAIYIINFTNGKGFILVSATKNYVPILAYSDSGNFIVSNDMPGGLKIWQEEALSAIKHVNSLPSDSVAKYRDCWTQYEEPKAYSSSGMDFLISDSDIEKAKAIEQSYEMELSQEGEICDLLKSITGDDALDEEIRAFIQSYIYPPYEDYWSYLSFVLKREVEEQTAVDNFVKTTWGQGDEFNSSFPMHNGVLTLAGCGPVAAGQIMYYHKYPSSFDWESMPLGSATTTTSDFLYEIAVKAGATFGTEAEGGTVTTIDNINKMLKSYGYTTSMGDHNAATAWKNIQNGMPVLMTATDSNHEHGHAWVASGGKYVYTYTSYEVYTFTTSTRFVKAATYNMNNIIRYYFYMNWGWLGRNDGFYLDNNLVVPTKDPYTAKNRKDIYDITSQ